MRLEEITTILLLLSLGYEKAYGASSCVAPNFFNINKTQKHYRLVSETTDHLSATIKCQQHGGYLAIMKTEEDFDDVREILGSGDINDVWIGLVNPSFEDCDDLHPCVGRLEWADGSAYDSDHALFLTYIQMNDQTYCLRTKKDRGGKLYDMPCHASLGFLCQYDCQSPNNAAGFCPSANPETDLIVGEYFVQKWGEDLTSYSAVIGVCEREGGTLLDMEEDYVTIRMMAQSLDKSIWIKHEGVEGCPFLHDWGDVEEDCTKKHVIACKIPCEETCTWTGWINSDSPGDNGNDTELVSRIRPCEGTPRAMSVGSGKKNQIDAHETGQVFDVSDPTVGFHCSNSSQSDFSPCHDYKVKFCCPDMRPLMDFCDAHPNHDHVTVLWKGLMSYAEGKAACKSEGMGLPVIRRPHHMWAVAFGYPGRRGWWIQRDFFLDAKAFGNCVNDTCSPDNIIWNDGKSGFDYGTIEGWLGVELNNSKAEQQMCLQVDLTKTSTGKAYGIMRDVPCDEEKEIFCFADCSNTNVCPDPPSVLPKSYHVGARNWLQHLNVRNQAKGADQT